MPFPISPFDDKFNVHLLTHVGDDSDVTSSIQTGELERVLSWLCTCPSITTYRVNTLKSNTEDVQRLIQQKVLDEGLELGVKLHPRVPNVVVLEHLKSEINLDRHAREVVVDVDCAAAILRGAHIYAPGVLGMMSGTQHNDVVSIYADLNKKCKKGWSKIFTAPKVFVANGVVKMIRNELFGENIKTIGIAVKIIETISGCPSLGDDFIPKGFALLQNLPSIVCVTNLAPQANEVILDMCASPGNKTTHIAELLKNSGILIAIDKTPYKVAQLKKRCDEFGAKVKIFQADSTKILANENYHNPENGPPFSAETFDRILLDAPCSVLGKRPQLRNPITDKIVKSYIPLQRNLIENAVKLLKPNGTLVYSTCTITLAENEGMVAWMLKTFPDIKLFKPNLYLGQKGWPGTSLTLEELDCVQRFGPDEINDSVGFFIACFNKIKV